MSSPSTNDLDPLPSLPEGLADVQPHKHLLSPVRLFAFWAAVALPFLYVPLLLSGLDSAASVAAFAALLVCNAVALLVGHGHNSE